LFVRVVVKFVSQRFKKIRVLCSQGNIRLRAIPGTQGAHFQLALKIAKRALERADRNPAEESGGLTRG
jgi:hypothetical protein